MLGNKAKDRLVLVSEALAVVDGMHCIVDE